jgi:prepilin-type N-terminal cleavage/methylation domain-containing protein
MFWHKIAKSKKSSNLSFRAQSGFTFLEIVISLLILSVGALSMLQIVNVAMDAHYRASQEVIASNLANALMAEILAKKFAESVSNTNIGPEASEARFNPPLGTNAYDDVDDYNSTGIFDGPPPITIGNLPMNGLSGAPNYPGFTRSVRVEFYNTTTGGVDPNPTSCKQITVTVNGPAGGNYELPGLKPGP